MFDVIAAILAFFYSLIPSYAFAIVGLTLVVMVVFTPLTFKSTKSMMAMQRLQPEIKRLQNKHKGGDRQALNEEMMALYQKHGVNPLAGCFPILLQMPVFLVLFRVLRGLTRRNTSSGFGLGARQAQIDVDGAVGSTNVFEGSRFFNPEYLSEDSELYMDLRVDTDMHSWGLNLADSAQSVLGESIINALPYLLLIAVVGFTGWYQQRQLQGRRTPGAEINPQQQMIMKIMPIFLPVISFGLPAALVIYFLVSNLFRLGQQAVITKRFYGEGSEDRFPTVEPLSDEEVEEAAKTAAKKKASGAARGTAASGTTGVSHGSRRPTTRKPPRNKNANRNGQGSSKNGTSDNTGSNNKKKAPGGGRVTPKGEQQNPQGHKKKKR